MPTVSDNRRERLRHLIDIRFDGSQTSFRDATGISLSQLGQWLNQHLDGSRNMGEKSARRIEQKCLLPIGWLDMDPDFAKRQYGEADTDAALRVEGVELSLTTRDAVAKATDQIILWEKPEDLAPDGNRVWIDRYDLVCSAGNGAVQWEVRQKQALPFTIDFFRAIGSNPSQCRLATARGDSMIPFLFDRDMIMIDTGRTAIRDGEVYAICFEDEMLVKQVFKQSGGALTLHSYNARYPDRTVEPREGVRFEVIGQVVYRSGSGLATQ